MWRLISKADVSCDHDAQEWRIMLYQWEYKAPGPEPLASTNATNALDVQGNKANELAYSTKDKGPMVQVWVVGYTTKIALSLKRLLNGLVLIAADQF
jgi:hypothetical protein